MPDQHGSLVLDTWVALVAGRGPWKSADRPHQAWIGLLTTVEIAALIVTSFGALRVTQPASSGWGTLVSVAAPLIASGGVVLGFFSQTAQSVWPSVVLRVTLLVAFILGLLATGQEWGLLWSSFVALAFGVDLSLTCLELGWEATPKAWYVRFLLSGVHWGVLTAVVVFVLVRGTDSLDVVLPAYLTMHLWVAGALTTLGLINSLYWRDVGERSQQLSDVIDTERRARAHWLHDNVCADLRLVSMKVETSDISRDDVLGLLDQFDHQIRLRQLEELMATGEITVAELLQPYIRRCQAHGAEVVGLPTFDTASATVSAAAGRLLARSAANFTANALSAGAARIAFSVELGNDTISFRVDDDAPASSEPELVPGRGLWRLQEDVRPGVVEFGRSELRGAFVAVSIPLRQ
jgi:hypothetical protein